LNCLLNLSFSSLSIFNSSKHSLNSKSLKWISFYSSSMISSKSFWSSFLSFFLPAFFFDGAGARTLSSLFSGFSFYIFLFFFFASFCYLSFSWSQSDL
jgi:hypothetical protein